MRADEKHRTHRLLDLLEWAPVDLPIANRAGAFARRYLRSHPGVDAADYVIAATAEIFDATLWTRNVRHFPMFQIQDPYDSTP